MDRGISREWEALEESDLLGCEGVGAGGGACGGGAGEQGWEVSRDYIGDCGGGGGGEECARFREFCYDRAEGGRDTEEGG